MTTYALEFTNDTPVPVRVLWKAGGSGPGETLEYESNGPVNAKTTVILAPFTVGRPLDMFIQTYKDGWSAAGFDWATYSTGGAHITIPAFTASAAAANQLGPPFRFGYNATNLPTVPITAADAYKAQGNSNPALTFTATILCGDWFSPCTDTVVLGTQPDTCSGFAKFPVACANWCSVNPEQCDDAKLTACRNTDAGKRAVECACMLGTASTATLPSTLDKTFAEFLQVLQRVPGLAIPTSPLCWYPGCTQQGALLTTDMAVKQQVGNLCSDAPIQYCIAYAENIDTSNNSMNNVIDFTNQCTQIVNTQTGKTPTAASGPGQASGPGSGPKPILPFPPVNSIPKWILGLVIGLVLLVLILGIGLGVGLKRKSVTGPGSRT